MRRRFLLFLFLIVLVFALFYKSPFSAMYNYNKAKALYTQGQYEQAIPYFERSLFADPRGILARFYYVLTLSKAKPVYSVQKKLYDMANSKINDEASKYAKVQLMYMKYNLLDGIENNYIYNASMGNDILRWDIKSFPLKVYFDNPTLVPDYYVSSIKNAMIQWTNHTNFVKFSIINEPSQADIYISFKDIQKDACENGVCKYAVAYTEPEISKDKILKKMNLTFYKTNPRGENFSAREVFNTALHELGHTLGIMGHSENPNDVMYSIKESDYMLDFFKSEDQALSARDLKTLVLLYRIEPTISNTKNQHSETFYYAPLVLGNDDLRLQKKLDEYRKYIQLYPHMASGYINLASVYGDLGDFDSALKALNDAEARANTTDERYLVLYNKAITYYNKQEITKALECAQKAQSIKDDNNVRDLISDIENLNK
ncbi:tetratricopeptide repeat protein [bacterium]|nr:tetratricopeptide repeat protein [bacterium]